MYRSPIRGELSKSVLAGLFAGIAAVVLCLIFNGFFRAYTGFTLSEIINVSTIIFGLTLLNTMAGVAFYFLHHYFKNGTLFYYIITLVLLVLIFLAATNVQRTVNPEQAREFRELLLGVIAITGVCMVFVVPYLFKRDLL